MRIGFRMNGKMKIGISKIGVRRMAAYGSEVSEQKTSQEDGEGPPNKKLQNNMCMNKFRAFFKKEMSLAHCFSPGFGTRA